MTELPTTAKARWIDTAEAAKLLRPQLKKTFPGVKFSVRISRYSGGSSIDVAWTDGPTEDQVEKVTHGFSGKRFDGMDDLAYGANSWFCAEHGSRPAATYGTGDDRSRPLQSRCCPAAELVHFGSNYLFTRRALSAAFTAELRAHVISQAGLPADPDLADYTYLPEGSLYAHGRYDTVRDGIYRASRTRAATLTREVEA